MLRLVLEVEQIVDPGAQKSISIGCRLYQVPGRVGFEIGGRQKFR